jgi:DNA-binding NtrC family response regulator
VLDGEPPAARPAGVDAARCHRESLLDYHGSKVKTAESLGMSRATIYRKIHQYGIITPAS